MANVTVQRLGDEAQADNDPHRLDAIRRDQLQLDKQISTRLSAPEIRAYGLVGGVVALLLLGTLAIFRWSFCLGVDEYAPTFGCTAATGLLWVYTVVLAVLPVAGTGVLLWGRIVRTRAEVYRARITRDRWSNPVDALAVLNKTPNDIWREFVASAAFEAEVAPFKQLPAGLDSLSQSSSQVAPKPVLTDQQQAAQTALATSQWLAVLEESPHLLIYGPSKAGKSTIAQAVVGSLGECDYVIVDPMPNKPGERKWGGVDFITLADEGDEASRIKTALQLVVDEDSRRRANMRNEVPRPLVVIIDEVLGLVDMLGVVRDAGNKTETYMSKFIRTMGASARHRGIKIILIGQGKNLIDLGLSSGTARNNYALVRAERNPATNERTAYIITPDGEQPIDVHDVPQLATRATQSGKVWLSHADAVRRPSSEDVLDNLLNQPFTDNGHGHTNGHDAPQSEEDTQRQLGLLVALREAGRTREWARDALGMEFPNELWARAGEIVEANKPKRGRKRAA